MEEVNLVELKKIVASLEVTIASTKVDYGNMLDMEVSIHADLGRTVLPLLEFIKMKKEYVIDLHKAAGESVALYINNKMFGKGDVMVYEKNLAIRVNEVLDSKNIVSDY